MKTTFAGLLIATGMASAGEGPEWDGSKQSAESFLSRFSDADWRKGVDEGNAAIARYSGEVAGHVQHFSNLQRQAAATAASWTPAKPLRSDAGPFLNPRLPWARGSEPPGAAPLALSPDVIGEIKGWGTEWLKRGQERKLGIDSKWIESLSAFDYWELTTNNPALGAQVDPLRSPLPASGLLLQWAKLHLIAGASSGRLQQAAGEIRHLAWLCYTTESDLIGYEAGVMLKLAGAATQSQTEVDAGEALKRLTVTSRYFFSVAAPVTARQALFPKLEADGGLGACTGITGAVSNEGRFSGALEDSLALRARELEQLVQKPPKGCRLQLARHALGYGVEHAFFKKGAKLRGGLTPHQAAVVLLGLTLPEPGLLEKMLTPTSGAAR